MEKSRSYLILLYVILASILTVFYLPGRAQSVASSGKDRRVTQEKTVDLLTWPEASQTAAREMRGRYGKPDVESEELIIWLDKKQWKMITITKSEFEHNFPIDHTDVLQQTVSYKVPAELYDELALFNGSISIDRTQGTMSARCDLGTQGDIWDAQKDIFLATLGSVLATTIVSSIKGVWKIR